MTAEQIAGRLHARQARPGEWRARCPVHNGRSTTSLSISESETGNVMVKCWAGCRFEDICQAVGVKPRNLFAGARRPRTEDRLASGVRSAVQHAESEFRRHPASRTEARLSVVVADGEHADAAIGRALALAAEGNLLQVALETESIS